MTHSHRRFALMLAAAMLLPSALTAQSPWTVTVTPTMEPLPIGVCGAVRLLVLDASGKGAPRGPSGALVTIADFDMGVVAEDPLAVVGHQVDDFHWSVCACQAAKVGSAATITARYPAKALAEKLRAPDVRVESSAPMTVRARMGDVEPPACAKQKAEVRVAEVAPSSSTRVPVGASRGGALEPAPLPAGTRPARALSAVAPSGVTASGVSPLIASITWSEVSNAIRYSVWRGTAGTVSVERTPPSFTAKQFRDTLPDPRPVYQYTVTAHYADGTSGSATAVPFTSPALKNPSTFVVKDRGLGNVDFEWSPVVGAKRYRLDGPGIPGTGFYTTDTSTRYPLIPRGAGSWKVTALYLGNYADYATATLASAVIRVLPAHATPWLTKNNGAGSLAKVQAPRRQGLDSARNFTAWSGDMMPSYDEADASWLGSLFDDDMGFPPVRTSNIPSCGAVKTFGCSLVGLKIWLNLFDVTSFDGTFTKYNVTRLWDDSTQAWIEAVYGNPSDLGVGRRSFCYQTDSVKRRGGAHGNPTAGPYTVCYATAHGIRPGQPGFNDPQTITHPGEGLSDDFILSMVIVKDPSGTVFLVFGKNGKYQLLPAVSLDTEGPKFVPFACIACHGGTYNATTRKVDGASLLPLDPNLLTFASPADQAAQEETIRQINFVIRKAQPQSAIASYLNGLYNGAIGSPGATAVPDFVPASWASQAGLYRSVVRPYCTMCHLAGPASYNFASWQNFQDNGPLIHASVCNAHTMPHAEIPFKSFWLKDTGSLYLPGLLAASLGFQSC